MVRRWCNFPGTGHLRHHQHNLRLICLVYAEGVKAQFTLPFVLILTGAVWLQGADNHVPRFEDYPVADIFTGAPIGPEHPGGLYNVKRETNFAGHYMVVGWAPGGDHLIIDVFDTKTGRVFPPPLFPSALWTNTTPFQLIHGGSGERTSG